MDIHITELEPSLIAVFQADETGQSNCVILNRDDVYMLAQKVGLVAANEAYVIEKNPREQREAAQGGRR